MGKSSYNDKNYSELRTYSVQALSEVIQLSSSSGETHVIIGPSEMGKRHQVTCPEARS